MQERRTIEDWWHAKVPVVEMARVLKRNGDINDNGFRDAIGRFAQVDEDTDPLHLLVSDYFT